jgi:hypothetical protein
VTTNIVTEISSYHAVPNVSSVEAKTGGEVKLTTTATLLIPYWKEFGELSPYEAFVDGKFTDVLLSTKSGDKTIPRRSRRQGFTSDQHRQNESVRAKSSGGLRQGRGDSFCERGLVWQQRAPYEPHERGQPFTDKCLTAAKRLGVALVRTTDLFEPARYLRDHPDAEYAMQCREAICGQRRGLPRFSLEPQPDHGSW